MAPKRKPTANHLEDINKARLQEIADKANKANTTHNYIHCPSLASSQITLVLSGGFKLFIQF